MLRINQFTKFAAVAAAVLAMSLVFTAAEAQAYGESNARALGMGGSYNAIARNYHSIDHNPANLGLDGNKGISVELFSLGTQLKNNAFSYGDYNKYTGAYLTDADKQDILAKIPAEGLNLQALAEGGAASFSYDNWAFSISGYGYSSVYLPKDPMELILYGNAVISDLELDDTEGEAWSVADIALGYGRPVKTWSGGELAVGGTVHYLRGIIYEKITSSEGYATTGDTAISAAGNILVKSSTGGSGYSFDLGLATRFEDKYYFNFAILNLVNKINWSDETEITDYSFRMDALNSNTMDDDSLTVSDDTSYAIESFGQKKPAVIKMGLSSQHYGILWAVDYEQGFSRSAASSVNPRISGGIEYRPLRWLPLRTGVSTGGLIGGYASFGFGLDFGLYKFDFALANQGSLLPNGSKGLLFSMSSGFNF
ncbi:MAG: hypothetical protein GF307_09330 [candidate division Zixibacteria bacterium]|nr:hypothetical protein [candidate division Zixibacteria bacterium]